MTDRRRLLGKLLRELLRCEARATEHPRREARRIGDAPPVHALREIADHAREMRPRLLQVIEGHAIEGVRGRAAAPFATLRDLVTDRMHDPERGYRATLLDVRHGVDVVRVLREVARLDELFALIRWCDDWLPARRTLIARGQAQLAWFADRQVGPARPPEPPRANDPDLRRDSH